MGTKDVSILGDEPGCAIVECDECKHFVFLGTPESHPFWTAALEAGDIVQHHSINPSCCHYAVNPATETGPSFIDGLVSGEIPVVE